MSQLSDLFRGVALPFKRASASLPGANPDILNTLAQSLSGCADARLMITGHSDSNGPDVAYMQIS